MRATVLALVSGLPFALASCGPATATCVPGRVEACACPGGVIGAQACLADGTFGACDCSSADAGMTLDAAGDGGAPADAVVTMDAMGLEDVSLRDGGLLPDAPNDAADGEDGGPSVSSNTYVIGAMTVPSAPTGDVAPGLNLDGKVSVEGGPGNCEDAIGDFRSAEGRTGVDNQLVGAVASLLGSLGINLQDGLDRSVRTGRLLYAVRVRGIESYANDDGVLLDLFLVRQAECRTDTCPVVGGVMAGDDWVSRAAAISTGTRGVIVDGTLTGSLDTFPIVAAASGSTLSFVLQNAQLIGDISPTAITRGNIGGVIGFDEIVGAAEMVMPGIGGTVRDMLTDRADLRPAAAEPRTCESFSAGLGFTAVVGNLVE